MPNPTDKKTIAVDIDDVLAEHIEAFINFSNHNHGTSFKPEDYNEHWRELWDISDEEVVERAQGFHTHQTVTGFGTVEDAFDSLKKLQGKGELVIVTARPKPIIDYTHEWVNKNFPNIFSEIHFVPVWDPGPRVTKAEICKKIGADYLIDDVIRHCNLAAEAGIKALWFERIKWRQPEELHPNVVKVASWREVLEYFDAEG